METLQHIMEEFKVIGHFSIGQVIKFTEKCLQSEYDDSDDDSDSSQPSRKDAYELVMQVISQPSDGTPDDYHNYAVAFAKTDNYTLACEVLEQGLSKYSANVDLLSDFLVYGIRSSKDAHYGICEKKYELLKSRRSVWTWRAYDFSIEYLLDKIDRGRGEPEEIKAECLKLALDFQVNLPLDERGYVAEARVHSFFNEEDNEINALEKAFAKDNLTVRRVGTSLAQIYLKHRKPDMAMKCMERVMKDIPNSYSNMVPSPVPAWLLLIVSKTAKLMSNWNTTSESGVGLNVDMKLVKEIIGDWDKAKKISDITTQVYKDTKGLVEFVKALSDYQSVDDDDNE